MEDHKKVPFIQILIDVEIGVVESHLKVNKKSLHGGHHQHEGHEEILDEGEVIEVVVEVINVNNQTMTQIVIIVRDMGSWQKTIIKRKHDAWNGNL
jgi:hypothetical protein